MINYTRKSIFLFIFFGLYFTLLNVYMYILGFFLQLPIHFKLVTKSIWENQQGVLNFQIEPIWQEIGLSGVVSNSNVT